MPMPRRMRRYVSLLVLRSAHVGNSSELASKEALEEEGYRWQQAPYSEHGQYAETCLLIFNPALHTDVRIRHQRAHTRQHSARV